MHADLDRILADLARGLEPPSGLTVPESAVENIRLAIPGGYHGPWKNDGPHYMVEPGEVLTERTKSGLIFCGPAQCGKTQVLVVNYAAHVITEDPADMLIFQTSQDKARDFSRRSIDRMLKASPNVGRRLGKGGSDDNTHDKLFDSGNILSIVWPSATQLAGVSAGIGVATDYDRNDDDINGEGSLFELLENRAKTFGTRAMTVAESSPSRHISDVSWRPSTSHEAPPCGGILGLFNTGDRRRAYCRCQHCGEFWLPSHGPEALWLPEEGSIEERAAGAGLVCTTCSAVNGLEHEKAVKASFRWLREGQTIDADGEISGRGRQTDRASFWLPGWAAAFERWEKLITKWLRAEDQLERSGDEKPMKTIFNTGFGTQYIPRARRMNRTAQVLAAKADAKSEALDRGIVPRGGRYLLGLVDNQKHSLEVQFMAFGVGGEAWVVDRFAISVSERIEDGKPVAIDAAANLEDFDVLLPRVLEASYPTADGREMKPLAVGMDMHGVPGLSKNAYAFYRKLRSMGKAGRFHLLRGRGGDESTPLVVESFPENLARSQKPMNALAAGDIPVLTLASNRWKDIVSNVLDREETGAGFLHLPTWAGQAYFEELVAESRGPKGWAKEAARNEAWDLTYYGFALSRHLGADRIDWDHPPPWAADWETNVNVIGNEAPPIEAGSMFDENAVPLDTGQW